MRVHVLQHIPFEGLGSIQAWLDRRRAKISWTCFFESDQLPEVSDLDFIIALGGPMSVNDEQSFPWLTEEKQFVAAAIKAGKPVLGICLGAQLIASSLGASVYPGAHKEIGWFDIESTTDSEQVFHFPKRSSVFHWHGETFDLPSGAIQLARSAVCENQAFQLGTNVIGLQFHLEMMPENVDAITTHCKNELVEGAFIQTAATIRRMPAREYEQTNRLMDKVLDYITQSIIVA